MIYRTICDKVVLAALCLLLAWGSMAQSNEGTLFYLGFMHHRDVNQNTKVVMITSRYNTAGSLTIEGRDFIENFEVKANEVTIVYLPSYAEVKSSEVVENLGIKVATDLPSSVYMHQYFEFRSEAALVLPVTALGKEYWAMAYQGVDNSGIDYPSEMLIVGVLDSTRVIVTTSTDTKGGLSKGSTFETWINEGEVYQIQASDSRGDVTGTHIIADKDIAVFSGARWTEVPTNCGFRDNLVEQMYSVETWGKSFLGVPAAKVNRSIFRILASENNTTIKVDNGTPIPSTFVLNQGQFIELSRSSAFSINADKPIQPAQFLVGGSCSGYHVGDPSMLLLNSIEQTRDTVVLYNSPFENITEQFITLIFYYEDKDNITIDGNNINQLATINPVGDSLYAYCRLSVKEGSHIIISKGCGLIASAYGYGQAESYAYSGGANFRQINFNFLPEGGCLGDTVFFDSKLSPARFDIEWDFGDGMSGVGAKTEHKYDVLGVYPLVVKVYDKCQGTTNIFTKDIHITLRQAVIASEDIALCEGLDLQLTANDLVGAKYTWQGPAGFVSNLQTIDIKGAKPSNTGTYAVTGTILGCSTFPELVEVTIFPKPQLELGNDSLACFREGESIPVKIDYFETIEWNNGSQHQERILMEEGLYWVKVEDSNGCKNIDSIFLSNVCPTKFFYPNVFSPNGDNINDWYGIEGNDILQIDLRIFDRWGNLVFTSYDLDHRWDGTMNGQELSQGVYVVFMIIQGIDEAGNSKTYRAVENITLIR